MITIKIKPEKGDKRWFRCRVFKTRHEMLAYGMQIGVVQQVGIFDAVTSSYKAFRKVKGKWKRMDMIGDILFYEGGFGAGVVAHEMAHATVQYFKMRRLKYTTIGSGKAWLSEMRNLRG